ncbi:MAG TPA: hypothetical protein VKE96_10380 [Vicinamibacterales bacterium]|nr:hypothetical protein [Vicinamibacterales bacterium]
MTHAHSACLVFLAVVTVSCSSHAPVKIAAGDQCFRCRRYISNERVAAETIDSNQFVSKFRGPGCLAKYLVAHPDDSSTVYVTDYTTGKLFPPNAAVYVSEVVDRKTGEADYRAYRGRAEADAYAAETHVMPIDWDEVLNRAR